jgi:hypothetical protein
VIVHVDERSVEELVRQSNEWRNHCEDMARRGLAYAQSIAPIKTGAYHNSLFANVSVESMPGGISGSPTVVIGSNDDAAVEIEFQGPKRYKTLLRTLDHLAEEV